MTREEAEGQIAAVDKRLEEVRAAPASDKRTREIDALLDARSDLAVHLKIAA